MENNIEMKWIENIKIDLQRRKFRRNIKRDAHILEKVIDKAEHISQRLKKRLWVFKVDAADYRIYTKSQMKGALRSLHLQNESNMYQTNEYVIHITKKYE